jgi:hypothetical protein
MIGIAGIEMMIEMGIVAGEIVDGMMMTMIDEDFGQVAFSGWDAGIVTGIVIATVAIGKIKNGKKIKKIRMMTTIVVTDVAGKTHQLNQAGGEGAYSASSPFCIRITNDWSKNSFQR